MKTAETQISTKSISQEEDQQKEQVQSFKLIEKISETIESQVYRGINLQNNSKAAIKKESQNSRNPQLEYEFSLYRYFHKYKKEISNFTPNVYTFWEENIDGKMYDVMVQDLLGPSLQDLFNLCGKKFSLKTTLMIADQLLNNIECLHKAEFLHRDINPKNFLIGLGENASKIYCINLGLTKRFMTRMGKHIKYSGNHEIRGKSYVYTSVSNHLGIELSRRDDLESIGYVLMYFLKGQLPWENEKIIHCWNTIDNILIKKYQYNSDSYKKFLKDLPEEFHIYLQYCTNLRFEQIPDYEYLKKLFKNLYDKQQYKIDQEYDWTVKLQKSKKNQMELIDL